MALMSNSINLFKLLLITALLISLIIIYYTRYYFFYCKLDILNTENKDPYLSYNNKNTKKNQKRQYDDKVYENNYSEIMPIINSYNKENNNKRDFESNYYLSRYICMNIYRDYKTNALTYYTLYKIYQTLEYIEGKEVLENKLLDFSRHIKRVSLRIHYFEGVLVKLSHLVIQITYIFFLFEYSANIIFYLLEKIVNKLSFYFFRISACILGLVVFFDFNIVETSIVKYFRDKLILLATYLIN